MRGSVVRALLGVLSALAFTASPAPAAHEGQEFLNLHPVFEQQNPTNAVNSDLAFWGKRAYAGDYDGFRIFNISNPARPRLLSAVRCFGPQNDPIVWRNKLLFLAVDQPLNAPECEATDPNAPAGDPRAVPAPDDPKSWEGVRIFDVSDPRHPRFVKGVYADCGAHTITLFPKSRREILIYVSSYPLDPGPTCGEVRGPEAGRNPLHGVIQVIRVPVNAPERAREIAEPRIVYPGDPDNRFVWAEHGLPPLPTDQPAARGCHDIGVFVELRLAAAACMEQGQLWRIRRNGLPDTRHPIWAFDDTVDETGITGDPNDPGVVVDFFHSATFSWDGKIVNFIDESFGAGCPPTTPAHGVEATFSGDTGRMFFLRTATGRLLSHFMIPRPESAPEQDPETGEVFETAYCSAHLGNVVRASDRYLLVNAWYTGGVDVIDFTNPRRPTEVAFYDAEPPGPLGSFNWSAYWYEGPRLREPSLTIYGTDLLVRGFQVFRGLVEADEERLRRLNPQTQETVLGDPVELSSVDARTRLRGSHAKGPARIGQGPSSDGAVARGATSHRAAPGPPGIRSH
jgi:LVIVD repeat-containing protein